MKQIIGYIFLSQLLAVFIGLIEITKTRTGFFVAYISVNIIMIALAAFAGIAYIIMKIFDIKL